MSIWPNKGTRMPGDTGEQTWFKRRREISRRRDKAAKIARRINRAK